MRISITPLELKVGDMYQNRRIVYIGSQAGIVYVDFQDGGYKSFQAHGQIEVVREVETIDIEKG